jgi:hypothetical protein
MTKTGQINNPGFAIVKRKKGSEVYTLYVTYTDEGPMYDAVCIDAEEDEFEIDLTDGCALIKTKKFKYLMLRPEQLLSMADLVEEAELHAEEWSKSQMGQDYATAEETNQKSKFYQKYKEAMNIRSEALVQRT